MSLNCFCCSTEGWHVVDSDEMSSTFQPQHSDSASSEARHTNVWFHLRKQLYSAGTSEMWLLTGAEVVCCFQMFVVFILGLSPAETKVLTHISRVLLHRITVKAQRWVLENVKLKQYQYSSLLGFESKVNQKCWTPSGAAALTTPTVLSFVESRDSGWSDGNVGWTVSLSKFLLKHTKNR